MNGDASAGARAAWDRARAAWDRARAAWPPDLAALVDAELAAGNAIVSVDGAYPAAPVGGCVRLARAISTRARASSGGVVFRERNSSLYAGEFSDPLGSWFVVEPPLPPPPEPDMDRVRERAHAPRALPPAPEGDDVPARFARSMVIDFDRWHDGIGYDVELIDAATPEERAAIEALLLGHGVRDWRDVEALARFTSPRAREALRSALRGGDTRLRAALLRYAPAVLEPGERETLLVAGLEHATLDDGLSDVLDLVAHEHPPAVVDALLRGVLDRDGRTAVLFAGLLLFLHGQAEAPVDFAVRPFTLEFDTGDAGRRRVLYEELCARLGVCRADDRRVSDEGGTRGPED